MPRPHHAILRFERHLQEAVDRFAQGLRQQIGDGLPPEASGGRLDALLAEEARLRRKARRNAPCYDLNRHIAVRRLISTLRPRPAPAA